MKATNAIVMATIRLRTIRWTSQRQFRLRIRHRP
jgi:hypothetical protein